MPNTLIHSRSASFHHTFVMLGAFVMAIAWLVPNHYHPWASFYNESCMAVGLLLLTIAHLFVREPKGVPIAVWTVVSVAVIPWLQFALGLLPFSGDAWISTLYLFGFASAIVVGHQWPGSRSSQLAVALSAAALIGAVISSCIGIDQTLGGGRNGIWTIEGPIGMQAGGNLGQPNNLATLIGFGAVGLLLLRERRILGPVSSVCLLIVLVLGAGLTRSRTALLFGPAILVMVLVFSRRHPGALKTRPTTIAVGTALHWIIAFAWPTVQSLLLLSTYGSTVGGRGLTTSRYQAWAMFIDALKEAPWFGYGWLQTGAVQFDLADRLPPMNELFAQSHNLFLDLVIWCGYPLGILLSLVIVFWFMTRAFRIASLEAACGMMTVSILGVHSMLELPFQFAYFLIPAGLWIGLIEASIGTPAIGMQKWAYAILTSTGLLLAAIWKDYPAVEADFRLFNFEHLRIGPVRAAQPAPSAPLMSTVTTYVRVMRAEPASGMSDMQLKEVRSAVRRYPYPAALYHYALDLGLNGDIVEGRRAMVVLRNIYGDPTYYTYRNGVRERANGEQPELSALSRSLPD